MKIFGFESWKVVVAIIIVLLFVLLIMNWSNIFSKPIAAKKQKQEVKKNTSKSKKPFNKKNTTKADDVEIDSISLETSFKLGDQLYPTEYLIVNEQPDIDSDYKIFSRGWYCGTFISNVYEGDGFLEVSIDGNYRYISYTLTDRVVVLKNTNESNSSTYSVKEAKKIMDALGI